MFSGSRPYEGQFELCRVSLMAAASAAPVPAPALASCFAVMLRPASGARVVCIVCMVEAGEPPVPAGEPPAAFTAALPAVVVSDGGATELGLPLRELQLHQRLAVSARPNRPAARTDVCMTKLHAAPTWTAP